MILTKYQRMTLINQFQILAKLYPDDASEYENKIKILQLGFTKNYDWLIPLEEEMSIQECDEVFDILEMFRAIHDSNQKKELSEKEKYAVTFRGFDGNNEPNHYSYAQYLFFNEGRYPELRKECEDKFLNSHLEVLQGYRKMLQEWKNMDSPRSMDIEALKRIANVKQY